MIQGLGTLKLFSDIDQNKVHEDFEFTQFKGLEEADDKGKFYERIQKDSFDENIIKYWLVEYLIKFKKDVSFWLILYFDR